MRDRCVVPGCTSNDIVGHHMAPLMGPDGTDRDEAICKKHRAEFGQFWYQDRPWEYTVTTTAGESFSMEEHKQLARLIFKRWGNDLAAATVAWRRLFQNSTSEGDFSRLVEEIGLPEPFKGLIGRMEAYDDSSDEPDQEETDSLKNAIYEAIVDSPYNGECWKFAKDCVDRGWLIALDAMAERYPG